MLIRKPLLPVQPDASLDPWTLVPVNDGEHLFYGFALFHPNTGGLSWLVSTEVQELDEESGRARTRSGCRYALGRRFEREDVAREGREAEIAYRLLLGEFADCGDTSSDPLDHQWVSCCKAARHLGLEPPAYDAAAVRSFSAEHSYKYFALRKTWWSQ
jgi:hypothetical protein